MRSVMIPVFAFLIISVMSMPIEEMDESTVKKLASNGKNVILKFYAPWCGHCKRFAPVFQQIVNTYDNIPNIVAGQIDCVKHKSYCQDSLIIGYPSVRLVVAGGMMRYFQDRNTAEKIVGFISPALGLSLPLAPPVELVNYIHPSSIAEALKNNKQTTVIMMWRPEDDNTKAMEMARHIAWNFLVAPSVQVYQTPLDNSLPQSLLAVLKEKFPQFVVINRGKVVYCDIELENGEMQEEALLDIINDYAGTNQSVNGKSVLLPGRFDSVEKLLKSVKKFDADEIKKVRRAVRQVKDASDFVRNTYLSYLHLINEKGMDAIWNLLEEKRAALDAVEDSDDDYEDLIIERNILRSLARDVEVIVQEEDELSFVCCIPCFCDIESLYL